MKTEARRLKPPAIVRKIAARLPQIDQPTPLPRRNVVPRIAGHQAPGTAHHPEEVEPRLVRPCMMFRLVPPDRADRKDVPEEAPRLRRGLGKVKT